MYVCIFFCSLCHCDVVLLYCGKRWRFVFDMIRYAKWKARFIYDFVTPLYLMGFFTSDSTKEIPIAIEICKYLVHLKMQYRKKNSMTFAYGKKKQFSKFEKAVSWLEAKAYWRQLDRKHSFEFWVWVLKFVFVRVSNRLLSVKASCFRKLIMQFGIILYVQKVIWNHKGIN